MLSFRPLVLMLVYAATVILLAFEGASYVRGWSLARLHAEGTDRLLGNITQLRTALDQYRYLPFVLTQSREVRNLLGSGRNVESDSVNRYLEQINLVAGSSALLVLDTEGVLRASSNWRDQKAVLAMPQAQMRYFKQAIAGNEGRQFIHEGRSGRTSLYLSAPIYDRQQLIGVAAMRLELDQLREHLPFEHPFMIKDLAGNRLLSLSAPEQLPQVEPELLADGTGVELVRIERTPHMRFSVTLDDLSWEISILLDARTVRQQQQLAAGGIAGGGIALGLLLLYVRESRQKRALQRAQARERSLIQERQQDMISTAQVGLINIDRTGHIQFINPMAMQQFGVSVELMKNRPVETLLGSGEATGLLRETLAKLGTADFRPLTNAELVGRRSDGTLFPMMVSVRGMAHHPELGYLVTVIDISRRKRLEQALREANESLEQKVTERTRALEEAQSELVQAGKLAALGRMSASVVHELNQPLTAIRTYLAIARRQIENPAMLADNMDQLEGLVDRMALITGQLKTFAYRKPEKLEPVALDQSIDQVLALFKGRFDEMQLQLEYRSPSGAIYLAGDQARFEQVLINLIKNACDAMQHEPEPHRLEISVKQRDDGVCIELSDNGPGIDPESFDQLFEPFFTTKEVGSGLGLGLAIVKSIVRDLGGDIDAFNRPEGGACFRLRMKRYSDPSNDEEL
jgi:PAS domain S-box-containing protein